MYSDRNTDLQVGISIYATALRAGNLMRIGISDNWNAARLRVTPLIHLNHITQETWLTHLFFITT